jgi:hypothetical protein
LVVTTTTTTTTLRASGAKRTILNVLPQVIKMANDGKKNDHARAQSYFVMAASVSLPICTIMLKLL